MLTRGGHYSLADGWGVGVSGQCDGEREFDFGMFDYARGRSCGEV